MSPPPGSHLLVGAGHTDVGGVAPGCDTPCLSQLPSADSSSGEDRLHILSDDASSPLSYSPPPVDSKADSSFVTSPIDAPHLLYECQFQDLHAITTDPDFDAHFTKSGYVPLTFPISAEAHDDLEDNNHLALHCDPPPSSCETSTTLTDCLTDDSSLSSVDSHEHYNIRALSSSSLPCSAGPQVDLLQDPDRAPSDTVPSLLSRVHDGARAYYALDQRLTSLGTSRSAFYREIRATESLLSPQTTMRAHLDGGAQVSTTDILQHLWHIRDLTTLERRVALRVADKTAHYPQKVGYLKVPTRSTDNFCDRGFTFIRCYWTPSLPATIISPSDSGKALGCDGYSTTTSFADGNCDVRLRNCQNRARDVVFPTTLVHGLLYTDPLLVSTRAQRSAPLPRTNLHVRFLEDIFASPSSIADDLDPEIANLLAARTHGPYGDLASATCTTEPIPAADDPRSSAHASMACSLDCHCLPSASCAPCADPSNAADSSLLDTDSRPYLIHHLTRDQLRILWHQRLGHMHSRRMSDLHRHIRGVPSLPIATELDTCSVCAQAKLKKAARRQEDSKANATQCYQGISIDVGFLVQGSKNTSRMQRLAGLNGETCYVLIVDHFSGALHGQTFRSKAPPIDFCNRWLAVHGLPTAVKGKYVRCDMGGELGNSPEIRNLFEQAGYDVQATAPNSSSSNGPGERPHQTIADSIRTMLLGAGLPPKFWPYAFHHTLRLYNLSPHGTRPASPFKMCTGKDPDGRQLKVFGCRVYALPARPKRPDKAVSDARTGIFLGYTKTLRNIIYYDIESEVVKTAQHVSFDEVSQDLVDKPLNARMLQNAKLEDPVPIADLDHDYPDIDISSTPFLALDTLTLPLDVTSPTAPFGVDFAHCPRFRRAYLSRFRTAPIGQSLATIRRRYMGSYVVALNNTPIFHLSDIENVLTRLRSLPTPPSTVDIVLAPERLSDSDDRGSPLHLRLHDLRRVCALQSVPREDLTSAEYQSALDAHMAEMSTAEMSEIIHRLQTDEMTDEERKLTRFSRKKLKGLSNWSAWDDAYDKQLDAHRESGTFGEPVLRPTPVDGRPPNVLRVVWSNLVKTDGVRKCRACLDGSKRAAPWLREFASTYASCIAQPCMRMFFAISAAKGLIVLIADTSNAFQQSPPPTEQCYLEIDEAYSSWYFKRYGKRLNPATHVVPVYKALQGHPEAGVLWEKMIAGILEEKGFVPTTQERNLYVGTIDGETVHVCRQVDDFAVAASSKAVATQLIDHINSRVTTENKGIGVRDDQGIGIQYNGVDIHQTRDYIKLSCESYISRLLQTHGWSTPDGRTSDRHDSVPLSPDAVPRLYEATGAPEGTSEHRALEAKVGYPYRQVLGELIYAYVVCRLDIGYAIALLAQFAQAPAEIHYVALKNVCRYLRRTQAWGLVYWRSKPVHDLPHVPLPLPPVVDTALPDFPLVPDLLRLTGYVDAAHATDLKTRRSVTGMVFSMAGGAIAYKSKRQATVATSSTEAEFIGVVDAAKVAKYLRSVLSELGIVQDQATPIYVDNKAAIAMVNENKPTTRSRHIDIQHFAIQEWRARGEIVLHHIPGIINCSDAGTKALGWTLHSRHVRRSLGHYGVP